MMMMMMMMTMFLLTTYRNLIGRMKMLMQAMPHLVRTGTPPE